MEFRDLMEYLVDFQLTETSNYENLLSITIDLQNSYDQYTWLNSLRSSQTRTDAVASFWPLSLVRQLSGASVSD